MFISSKNELLISDSNISLIEDSNELHFNLNKKDDFNTIYILTLEELSEHIRSLMNENVTYSFPTEEFNSTIEENNFNLKLIIQENKEELTKTFNIKIEELFDLIHDNIDNKIDSLEDITDNFENTENFLNTGKLIVNYNTKNYNLDLNFFFYIIFNNTNNSKTFSSIFNLTEYENNYITDYSNYKLALYNNGTYYNFTFKYLFAYFYNLTLYKFTGFSSSNLFINNSDSNITINNFIKNGRVIINYQNISYNFELNQFFIFLFKNINIDTNIDIDYDIDLYNISINNNNTINNIKVKSLFKYFIKKFNNLKEIEPPSNNNIDIYYYNNEVIFDTKKNVSFESISLTSDIRFKENINPINNSLNKINKLKPREFNYKNSKNKKCIGFIAQDILETELEYIVEQNDKEHYKVDYNNVIGLLTGSVQELSQELKSLKQEMRDIKEQNKLLKELLFKSSNL